MRNPPPLTRRQLRAQKDRRGLIIIATCGFILITAGAFAAYNRPPPHDAITGCVRGALAKRHTIVVVDKTDPWKKTHESLLRAALTATARDVPVDDRLSILAFDGSAAAPSVPQFSRCNVGDASTVNALFKTPARVQKKYEVAYTKPLEATLASITRSADAKETHLVEFLADLAAHIGYDRLAEHTRIIVYTDLAEHTPDISFYTKKPVLSAQAFAAYVKATMRDRLAGIDLAIRYVPAPNTTSDMTRRIKAAWTLALTESGAYFTIEDF